MNEEASTEGSRYWLMSTPRGDIIFHDGPRNIEVDSDTQFRNNVCSIRLYAISLKHWNWPYGEEVLTDEIKEEILKQTARLLEARDARVKVEIVPAPVDA